jgi:hypothetical protein
MGQVKKTEIPKRAGTTDNFNFVNVLELHQSMKE